MDWDNLRFFLELARTGTLAGAARRLGVEHTTVSRRIQALEKQMGATLFAREAGGHRLAEAGRHLLPSVEAMEAAVLGVERAAPAPGGGPSGLVRVGATEGFGTLILAPHLACLTQKHPQLSIDLLALPRMLHLSRREADIIISLERPTRGSVIVVRLTDYVLHLYGQRDYLARSFPITQREDLCHHAFISYVDDLLFTKELQFLDALHQPERFGHGIHRAVGLLVAMAVQMNRARAMPDRPLDPAVARFRREEFFEQRALPGNLVGQFAVHQRTELVPQ